MRPCIKNKTKVKKQKLRTILYPLAKNNSVFFVCLFFTRKSCFLKNVFNWNKLYHAALSSCQSLPVTLPQTPTCSQIDSLLFVDCFCHIHRYTYVIERAGAGFYWWRAYDFKAGHSAVDSQEEPGCLSISQQAPVIFVYSLLLFTCFVLTRSIVPMWRTDDNLQGSVLSFHPVGPRERTQVLRLGGTCWNILLARAHHFLPTLDKW